MKLSIDFYYIKIVGLAHTKEYTSENIIKCIHIVHILTIHLYLSSPTVSLIQQAHIILWYTDKNVYFKRYPVRSKKENVRKRVHNLEISFSRYLKNRELLKFTQKDNALRCFHNVFLNKIAIIISLVEVRHCQIDMWNTVEYPIA